MGFDDAAVILFKAYLTNRFQSVKVNGVVSDPQAIQFGVPQESMLYIGVRTFLNCEKAS